jgi:uncharacterized OsmC-like protein
MKIIMHTEEHLEFKEFDQPGFDIEAHDPEAHYSALQMFATSLALCTFSVLVSYGETIDASTDNVSVRVRWSYVEHPFRIGHIDMDIRWPGVPPSRLRAARVAASHCTIHHTLEKPPEMVTEVHR